MQRSEKGATVFSEGGRVVIEGARGTGRTPGPEAYELDPKPKPQT